jgi:hypothetical protein
MLSSLVLTLVPYLGDFKNNFIKLFVIWSEFKIPKKTLVFNNTILLK